MIILSTKKGFTLIETLVAITILMIAIAGPLSISAKGYSDAIDARNQSVAFNLAQEGLEYLNNVKDNQTWEAKVLSPYDCIGSDHPCVINGLNERAGFTRRYYVNMLWLLKTDPSYYEMITTVTVSWKTGSVANQVMQQQTMTFYAR